MQVHGLTMYDTPSTKKLCHLAPKELILNKVLVDEEEDVSDGVQCPELSLLFWQGVVPILGEARHRLCFALCQLCHSVHKVLYETIKLNYAHLIENKECEQRGKLSHLSLLEVLEIVVWCPNRMGVPSRGWLTH